MLMEKKVQIVAFEEIGPMLAVSFLSCSECRCSLALFRYLLGATKTEKLRSSSCATR